jgi:hypothetical protein
MRHDSPSKSRWSIPHMKANWLSGNALCIIHFAGADLPLLDTTTAVLYAPNYRIRIRRYYEVLSSNLDVQWCIISI